MEKSQKNLRSTEKFSWRCTLLTQAALFLALYGAFNIGTTKESRNPGFGRTRRNEALDLYFLSVRGGIWPENEQSLLLNQMERAAEFHRAKFVVNIGELGEEDPLMQNATPHFSILKIPWLTTSAGDGTLALSDKSKECFLKKINIGYDEILDIVGLNTGLLKKDFSSLEHLKESGSDQLHRLQQILSATDSKWRIVVGFHPLMICRKKAQNSVELYEPLHRIFLKHRVNAYLSEEGCAGPLYNSGGIAYLGNPGPTHHEQNHSENGNISENTSGFLLHRVTPLEIESYFISLTGAIVSSSKIYQHGRGVM